MRQVQSRPGELTFKIAAIMIGASAFVELTALLASVPLFGHVVSGVAAVPYHLGYVVLFAVLGYGIWGARRWAYQLLLVTCLLYVIDRVQSAVYVNAIRKYLYQQFEQHQILLTTLSKMLKQYPPLDLDLLIDSGIFDYLVFMMQVTSVMMAACWAGFGLWAYWRRAYFGIDTNTEKTL
jgi:hypothetical protein